MFIAPKFWIAFRSLTITFLRDMETAPFERFAVTIIGSISGVSPTATDTAKMKASSQSPLVMPLTRKTNGTMMSMKRMSSRLTRAMPRSNAVAARWPTMARAIVPR